MKRASRRAKTPASGAASAPRCHRAGLNVYKQGEDSGYSFRTSRFGLLPSLLSLHVLRLYNGEPGNGSASPEPAASNRPRGRCCQHRRG